MKRDFAESFSLSFHPLLVTFYSLLFIFVLPLFEISEMSTRLQISITTVVAITTIILPAISLLILKRQNTISSFQLENREERTTPYFLTFAYYGITAIMLYRLHFIPPIIPLVMIVAAAGCLSLLLMNLKLKVSAHAMGMGSLSAMMGLLMYFFDLNLVIPLTVVLLLSLIVMASRHYLKAHSLLELIIGYLSGIVLGVGIGYFWLNPYYA